MSGGPPNATPWLNRLAVRSDCFLSWTSPLSQYHKSLALTPVRHQANKCRHFMAKRPQRILFDHNAVTGIACAEIVRQTPMGDQMALKIARPSYNVQ